MVDFPRLAQPGISGLSPYRPGKSIEEMERESGVSDIAKLASNENPLGPSPRVVAALVDHLQGLARYPDGSAFLFKNKLRDMTGFGPERVTLGNGSNEVLELLGRVFLGPGTESIVSEHAFIVYSLVTRALGGKVVEVPTVDYRQDLDATLAAISEKTRMVFIANPNNPTGTWVTRDALVAFLDKVPQDLIIVLDEAYFEYAETAPGYPDGLSLVDDYPNLVVTRTLSKAYGLAGLRLGYGISHPAVADLMNRVRPPFNVNSLALAAGLIALDDQEHIRRSVRVNARGKVFLEKALNESGLACIPSAGNFLTVDFGKDAMPIYESLLREGVIVRPVGAYGLPNHLRITIGTSAENLQVIDAIRKVLETL